MQQSGSIPSLRWWPVGGRVRRRGASGAVGRYLALWAALLALSALIVILPGVPVAWSNPMLAASVATLAGVVGLVLLYLGVVRFLAFGRPVDLYFGLGFGVLALANLAVRLSALALDASWAAAPWLLLLLRALTVALFLLPLARPGREIEPDRRARYALGLGGAAALAVLIGVGALVAGGDDLPASVEPATRQLLEANGVVFDFLPGQAWWLLLVNGCLGLLMLAATVGYVRQARNGSEAYLGAVATALTLLSFAELHTLLFPAVVLDYVSTASLFRLVAYLVVTVSLIAQSGRDMVERAGREERERLSRELHDGLMQQLSLLNLRLNRARSPRRPAEARACDLDASVRVLEAAMLEARQAIVALRTGVVAWEQLTESVSALTGAFEANHGVTIVVHAAASGPALEASLQADVLRIVHEACSNAVRHGGAGQIEVMLAAGPGVLDLRIRDDGSGFDPARADARPGLGLRSFKERAERRGGACRVDSAPGRGTTVSVRFRLALPRTGEP
ncbi:MAG: histidine kinase [Chloroflexota bacterium]|nr:histidine kinase [Chloroflexota bacterium]